MRRSGPASLAVAAMLLAACETQTPFNPAPLSRARQALASLVGAEQAIDAPVLAPPPGEQQYPSIAFGGGEFLVVFGGVDDNGLNGRVEAARVEPTGQVLDATPILVSNTLSGSRVRVAFGAGVFALAWEVNGDIF